MNKKNRQIIIIVISIVLLAFLMNKFFAISGSDSQDYGLISLSSDEKTLIYSSGGYKTLNTDGLMELKPLNYYFAPRTGEVNNGFIDDSSVISFLRPYADLAGLNSDIAREVVGMLECNAQGTITKVYASNIFSKNDGRDVNIFYSLKGKVSYEGDDYGFNCILDNKDIDKIVSENQINENQIVRDAV